MVAGRYRIISMLGKGGMGEVYRADDLNLGQEVALKFLPEEATSDDWLERFRTEVRIARQISHPNVCRIYDIGEADRHIYLSMEYIDGEDLASLLRRIGRLPSDKAVEIARKVCAGLAAAHHKGVLHRDLKPANIMLDGRGEALITDFGLAGLAAEITDIHSGTPAYMAPEQLSGKEVTQKSDIYSLGLVLYELFTGKRAFDGRTLEDITRVRRDGTISRPSTLVKDIDPAVERAIFRCLEDDPNARPSSALEVSAALPGGDPLAAALAAGETPSPQLVAAAGDRTGVPVKVAVGLFAGIFLGLLSMYVVGLKTSSIERMNPPFPVEVLSQKARDIIVQLGYTTPRADSIAKVDLDGDLYRYLDDPAVKQKTVSWDNALKGRPNILHYWRRESPDNLVATEVKDNTLIPGIVTLDDPSPLTAGMLSIVLDLQGRLQEFDAVPPQRETSHTPAVAFDWNIAFSSAGLDMAQFKPATPEWNPLATSDWRGAWVGTWPGTASPLRVEAASYRGKPVYFSLIGDWTKPDREVGSSDTPAQKTTGIVITIFGGIVLLAATLFAYRNVRKGKVDAVGTVRLAALVFVIHMGLWLCRCHFVPSIGSFGLFILFLAGGLFITGFLCTLYLAIEPFVRRHWPHAIISWARLLSGKLRDPLVGRDVMIGIGLGIFWALAFQLVYVFKLRAGAPPLITVTDFIGMRQILGRWFWHLETSLQATLGFFFVLFLLRVLLRKPWLATCGFVAFWAALKLIGSHYFVLDLTTEVVIYGVAALVVVRFGFLSLAIGIFVADMLLNMPVTTHLGEWYAGGTDFVLVVMIALTSWSFYTALAGQKLWKESLID
jgi:serine/threonine protein kinase